MKNLGYLALTYWFEVSASCIQNRVNWAT